MNSLPKNTNFLWGESRGVLAHTAPPTHRTGPSRTGGDRLPDHAVQTMPETRQDRL
jgi:hypothetical protein